MNIEFKPSSSDSEKARKLISGALQKSSDTLHKDENIDVVLGWTENEFVKNKFDGVIGKAYSSNKIEIEFNSTIDGWERFIKPVTAHEYAHTWFFEKAGANRNKIKWKLIASEALTQNFTEEVYSEVTTPWREKISLEEASKYWNQVKEELTEEVKGTRDPLFFGNREYPKWLGYAISYHLGKTMLKNENWLFFTQAREEDIKKYGDQIFN